MQPCSTQPLLSNFLSLWLYFPSWSPKQARFVFTVVWECGKLNVCGVWCNSIIYVNRHTKTAIKVGKENANIRSDFVTQRKRERDRERERERERGGENAGLLDKSSYNNNQTVFRFSYYLVRTIWYDMWIFTLRVLDREKVI